MHKILVVCLINSLTYTLGFGRMTSCPEQLIRLSLASPNGRS
jgi:hypothetical protein